MIYQLQLHLVQTNLMKVYINMNHTVILLYHHSDVSRLVYDKATLLLNSTITMRCRILLQVFLCIILLTLAESWWSRSSGSSSRSSGSSSRSSGSSSRSSGSSRKTSSWFWRRGNSGSTTRGYRGVSTKIRRTTTRLFRKPDTKPPVSKKILDIAITKVDSTKWSQNNTWRFRPWTKNGWKCNLFVNDILKKAHVKVPSKSKWFNRPISTKEWGNPESPLVLETKSFEAVPFADRKPGDIIVFNRSGDTSGHMGIVKNKEEFIGAGKDKVSKTSIDGFRNNSSNGIVGEPVVWRIKEKQ